MAKSLLTKTSTGINIFLCVCVFLVCHCVSAPEDKALLVYAFTKILTLFIPQPKSDGVKITEKLEKKKKDNIKILVFRCGIEKLELSVHILQFNY